MARLAPFRVKLWDIDTSNRGRNNQVAFIEDASDVGVSSYANEGGEMFFTIPQNHPQISQIQPWLRHYEVSRRNSSGTYEAVGVGLLDNYDADNDEVIVYGRDYLSLFDVSISEATTSYTSATYTNIITTELSAAINQSVFSSKSVTKFISLGTISSTSETTTVLTSYQPRLQFLKQLCDIISSDDSTRPIVSVTRSSPFTVTWGANVGSDKNDLVLEYGGNVNRFRFDPGYDTLASRVNAIGQKREGASLLFAASSFADLSTYGLIQTATVFIDIINQTALNRKTARMARDLGTPNKHLSLQLRSGAVSPVDFNLGDSLPVKINRGLVQLNSLYTAWGWEWTAKKDGSEDLFIDLLPKRT